MVLKWRELESGGGEARGGGREGGHGKRGSEELGFESTLQYKLQRLHRLSGRYTAAPQFF
jgi:hypothetical protein